MVSMSEKRGGTRLNPGAIPTLRSQKERVAKREKAQRRGLGEAKTQEPLKGLPQGGGMSLRSQGR